MEETSYDSKTEKEIAYACGYIESWLQIYAASIGLPTQYVAARVGQLLHSTQDGQILWPHDSLPALRRKTAKRRKVRKSTLAVARGSYRKAQKTTHSVVSGLVPKKPHWTQLPENKKKVAKILKMAHKALAQARRA